MTQKNTGSPSLRRAITLSRLAAKPADMPDSLWAFVQSQNCRKMLNLYQPPQAQAA